MRAEAGDRFGRHDGGSKQLRSVAVGMLGGCAALVSLTADADEVVRIAANGAPQGEVRLARVGSRGYAIPTALIYGAIEEGIDQDEILIAGLLPGLSPRPPRAGTDESIDQRLVQVTLTAAAMPLAVALDEAILAQGEPVPREPIFGLTAYAFTEIAEGALPQELLVVGSREHPMSFLFCRPAEWPSAGCTQWLDHDGVRLQLSWSRAHLSEWRAIARTVTQRLDGFGRDFRAAEVAVR